MKNDDKQLIPACFDAHSDVDNLFLTLQLFTKGSHQKFVNRSPLVTFLLYSMFFLYFGIRLQFMNKVSVCIANFSFI